MILDIETYFNVFVSSITNIDSFGPRREKYEEIHSLAYMKKKYKILSYILHILMYRYVRSTSSKNYSVYIYVAMQHFLVVQGINQFNFYIHLVTLGYVKEILVA